jgi:undecaprenyl-diphosphatase
MGTLLAVILFFRRDLKEMIYESCDYLAGFVQKKEPLSSIKEKPHAMLAAWVIVGTLPTVLIGFTFKDQLENLFGEPRRAAWMLIITGILLVITKILPAGYTKRKNVGLITALPVGIAQGLAITPGISRSGSTIVCGMICGMDRELAGRFSFLLSIPAITGAMILQLASKDLGSIALLPLATGFFSAAVIGFFALKFLMIIVKKGSLSWFAPYCWALGLSIILFF